MYLPLQREPVQRSTVASPSGNQNRAPGRDAVGVMAGRGVEPSGVGSFDDLTEVFRKIGQAGQVTGPFFHL